MAFASFDIAMVFNAVNNARGVFTGVHRDLDKTKTKATQTANRLRAIQLVLSGIAIGAAIQLGKSITALVSDFEQLNLRLNAVQGGSEKATAVLNKMVDAFGKTSVGVKTTTDGLIKLQAAGLTFDKAFRTVSATADAVAAFGGTAQEFNRAIIGMQQTIGKGTASMEELRQQIGEAIPAAMFVAAEEMDIGVATLISRISRGEILGTELVDAMTRGFEKNFGGFLEIASNSISGALAQIKTTIEVDFARIFTEGGGAGEIKRFLFEVNDALKEFISSISEEDIRQIVDGFRGLVDILSVMLPIIVDLTAKAGTLLGVLGDVVEWIKDINIFSEGSVLGDALDNVSAFTPGTGAIHALDDAIDKVAQYRSAVDDLKNVSIADVLGDVGKVTAGDVEQSLAIIKEQYAALVSDFNSRGTIFKLIYGDDFESASAIYLEIISQLEAGTGELFDKLKAFETLKGLELTTAILGKDFDKAVQDVAKLSENLDVSNFEFGSSTQKRFEQRLAELNKALDSFRERIELTRKEWTEDGGLTGAESAALERQTREVNDLADAVASVGSKLKNMTSIAADEYFEGVEKSVLGLNAQISKFVSRNGADNLEDRLAKVRDEGAKLANNIDDLIRSTESLAGTDARYLPLLELLYNARERMNRAGDEAIQIETALYNIEMDKLRLQTEQVQLQTEQAKLRLDREFNQSAFLQGLGAFDSTSIAEDQRLALKLEINQSQQELDTLNAKIASTRDEGAKALLIAQRESINQLIASTKEALASVSAYAVASRQVWADVGRSVQDLAKGALRGLIDGTLNAKDLLIRFWSQITDAAIDYIFQLIFIKGLMGTIFGGLGNPFGFLGGFASGGAFAGNVKPFANGDIIKGPTLFGLAGEAGTEAIMPLTRGTDGKLGVQAVGGGGDTFHITIQAIDTQSGAQFLAKNADVIVQQLHRANRMNKGVGSMI